MTKSDQLNRRSNHRFAYIKFGKHVMPGGNRYGYAGYCHVGSVTFLGRTFDRACETIDREKGVAT